MLYRLREVIRQTGLSKSSIYRLEQEDRFPKRVRISARASGWRADEITRWCETRPRADDIQDAA